LKMGGSLVIDSMADGGLPEVLEPDQDRLGVGEPRDLGPEPSGPLVMPSRWKTRISVLLRAEKDRQLIERRRRSRLVGAGCRGQGKAARDELDLLDGPPRP
jgi:hypothetical protein